MFTTHGHIDGIAAIVFVVACVFVTPAQAEIYKCSGADGGVIYQQTPCKDHAADSEPDQHVQDEEDEESVDAEHRVDELNQGEARAVDTVRDADAIERCKQPYRDAIDAIEAEMLRGYRPEQGEVYRQRLRALTQQMRRC